MILKPKMMSKFQAVQSEIYFFITVVIISNSFFKLFDLLNLLLALEKKKKDDSMIYRKLTLGLFSFSPLLLLQP